MKAIAFTSVVLLHLFCYAEGSLLDPLVSLISASPTCNTPAVASLSCILVEVVNTYIYVICDGLRVLENVAALIAYLSGFFPYPFEQILLDFFNGIVLGSKELTDVCSTQIKSLSDFVKEKCPKSILFSVISKVLSTPLIQGKLIIRKIQCLNLDWHFYSFPFRDYNS